MAIIPGLVILYSILYTLVLVHTAYQTHNTRIGLSKATNSLPLLCIVVEKS